MNGDVHVRFWESAGVRFPRATHRPVYRQQDLFAGSGWTPQRWVWPFLMVRRNDSRLALIAR